MPDGRAQHDRHSGDAWGSLRSVAVGSRFLARLPSFLHHPINAEESRAILRRRLELRERNFLGIVERAIYKHPASPYLSLLRHAGCEFGDLMRLVDQEGVEGALRTLHGRGVYLTVDEFKGRRAATRGSRTIELHPDRLRNPLAAFHLPGQSGGSRSSGTRVLIDLAFVRGCAVNACLALEARGGAEWLKAIWETPGAGARFRLLKFSNFGLPPVRWFSQVDPAAPGLDPIFRWSERAMRWGSGLAGFPLPRPLHVGLSDPLPIAEWIAETLHAGRIPHLFTFASSAVRLCQAASGAGVELRGAQFLLAGEPTTAARLAVIERTGAKAVPRYGSMECGPIGYGCLEPDAPDDVHLLHDLHALIQPSWKGHSLPEQALFVSSLHPASPFTMLNVSMGDQALVVQRSCGCAMEEVGWSTHLRTIRSYEKLTGEGVTFLHADVVRVLEVELPARFGGAPTDYQLVEEEAEDGRPRLRLFVHPRVGPQDSKAIAETFLSALGAGSPVDRVMELVYRDADILRVERRAPLATRSGKILHLHVGRPERT